MLTIATRNRVIADGDLTKSEINSSFLMNPTPVRSRIQTLPLFQISLSTEAHRVVPVHESEGLRLK